MDHGIIGEPTQPFSRSEIERMRQVTQDDDDAAPVDPGPDPDGFEAMITVKTRNPLLPLEGPDWFELDGRRIRVSLDPFVNFGQNGAPPGMLNASVASFISGEITPDGVPTQPLPRLAMEYEAAPALVEAPAPAEPAAAVVPATGEDELLELEAGLRARTRRVILALAAALLLGLGSWLLVRAGRGDEQPAAEPGEQLVIEAAAPTQAREPTDEPVPELAAVVPEPDLPAADDADDTDDEQPSKSRERKSTSRKRSVRCKRERARGEDAKRDGRWAEIVELHNRKDSCLSDALWLRALFELERYKECMKFEARARTKEEKKWVNNCKRALQ